MDKHDLLTLQRHIGRLPVELQWRIGNEVLFGTHTLPGIEELLCHPCSRTGHDATLRAIQLQLIVRQRCDAFVQLQRERRWMRAVQTRSAAILKELLNDDATPSAAVLSALRHSVKQAAFFTHGSAAYMLAVLDVLQRADGVTWLPADRADVLGRMIEYCVKEEETMLLHASVWWLLWCCFRGKLDDANHILALERRARCALFEWSNVDRLPHYIHALTMHDERSHAAAAATVLHDMPLTVVVLTAWIAVEAWSRRVAVAVLKAVAVVLAGVIGRRIHAHLRRALVRKAYAQMRGSADVDRQPAPRAPHPVERRTTDQTTAAARRPRQQWWCNEVLVRNASSRSTLHVHAYNAADHYLLTHAFSSASVAPRSVAVVRSAWDLRGTRIVVSRCVDDGNDGDKATTTYVDWRRGSTFNLHRKPSLLVAKNATLTVRDGDFVGDTAR